MRGQATAVLARSGVHLNTCESCGRRTWVRMMAFRPPRVGAAEVTFLACHSCERFAHQMAGTPARSSSHRVGL